VLDRAREDIGDGLDAAVRVPGEALEIVLGMLVAKVVEEQEGIELAGFAEAESPLQANPSAFESGFGREDFFNWPE
jgi:hypothetical protein